ncbi:MAG: hypothetical protein IT379_10935, partial [Deltaproteobacteria bacterium]|nr:hypothetical protein [Deltaproteobacteria bacterium]
LDDDLHCGACDRICPNQTHCSGGECVCDSPWSDCDPGPGFLCIDIAYHDDHCGECGNSCPLGTRCREGHCVSCARE